MTYDNVHDTLLGHHTYASHLPQRLDQVVSEYLDSTPWKVTFGRRGTEEKGLPPAEMTGEDLCRYNAGDALRTALAWERMQEDLAPEWAVYEHDRALAGVCRDMQIAGIGVDKKRQDELMAVLKHRGAALKGQMRALCHWPEFQPSRVADVRAALFRRLRAKWTVPTSTGLPSTSDAALEAITGTDTKAGDFCDLLLRWRVVMKIRSTYLKTVEVRPGTFRVHYNWKPFGTVSGRLSCRFQSVPRFSPRDPDTGKLTPEGRVREIYVPAPGNVFFYFDVSQAEMRLAAYLSNDAAMIEACKGDVHANNAKAVFSDIAARGWLDGDAKKDPARGKKYRDIAKNLGFAISYCAEAEKVFITLRRKGFEVSMRAVEVILAKLHTGYHRYYRWVENNLARVRECGFMRTPFLGRIRWLGWFAKITEVANFPIQSALADIMNRRVIDLAGEITKRKLPIPLVAQVHDACVYDCPEKHVPWLQEKIASMWAEPIETAGGKLVLPIDAKVGMRLSEL